MRYDRQRADHLPIKCYAGLLVIAWLFLDPGTEAAHRSCVLSVPADGEVGTAFQLHSVRDSVLVAGSNALFVYESGELTQVSEEELYFISIHEVPDGVLVGAVEGVYRYHAKRLSRVPSDSDAGGGIYHLNHAEAGILVAGARGLFRYEGGVLQRVPDNSLNCPITKAYRTYQLSEAVLVLTSGGGLCSYHNDTLHRVVPDTAGVTVRGIHKAGETVFATTDKGLFVYNDGRLSKVHSPVSTGIPYGVELHPEGTFVFAERGLFKYDENRLSTIPSNADTGSISGAFTVGGRKLFAAANGLFIYREGRLMKVESDVATGRVAQVHELRASVLVRAREGLFRYNDGGLQRITSDVETGGFFGVDQLEHAVVARSDHGAFSYDGTMLRKIPSDTEVRQLYDFLSIGDENLVGGVGGVFRIVTSPAGAASGVLERDLLSADIGELRTIKARVDYECAGALRLADFRLIDADRRQVVDGVVDENLLKVASGRAVWSARVRFDKAGTYRVRLALLEEGNMIPISQAVEFRVAWGPLDWFKHVGPWLLVLHSLLFAALVFGSRWSRWCFSLVMDPVWGRTGLWLRLAVRYIGPLQRWVMSYWFNAVRRSLKVAAYVPLPLTDRAGNKLFPADLPDRLKRTPRLWIQGNAGMGKTAMIEDIERALFGSPEFRSLRSVYRRYGFVPIVIRLRRFSKVAPDLQHPEMFVPDLARRAVAEYGVEFADLALFRAILENSGMGVLLDGANEIMDGDYLELSAAGIASRCILITSQSLPVQRADSFEVLRLPSEIGEAVEPLLREFLGNERGELIFRQIAGTPLARAMRSGYDVRLLADLAEGLHGEVLPVDRLGLYGAIIEGVSLPEGGVPEDELCQAAWRIWREGERRLIPDKHLARDIIMLLWREEGKVLRSLRGEEIFEFRHDQMRGYLAARWLAVHVVAPLAILDRDDSIWRLSRSEQEVVWSFFAALVTRDVAVEIWQWSTRSPERAVLQQALQNRATSEEWQLVLG